MIEDYAVEMTGISKAFPGVLANDDITLKIRSNTIHAILGENGAGKSTLMSILFGSYHPDSGTIRINGKDARIRDPKDATGLGLGMVHQHFKLVNAFTAAENIILGNEPENRNGSINFRQAEERVASLSDKYGLDINPRERVENMSVCAQQRLEILKVLYTNAKTLILDEPTSVLRPQEIDDLIRIIHRLKEEGKTIVLITHKLREIKETSDYCTILRHGKVTGNVIPSLVMEHELASLMIGRDIDFQIKKNPSHPEKVVLKLENISVRDDKKFERVHDFSLEVRGGEILGIAGVDGNGQTELVEAIIGLRPVSSGKVFINGQDATDKTIRERINMGVGHVPEDRGKHGFIPEFRLDENLALKNFRDFPYSDKFGLLDKKVFFTKAAMLIDKYDVRAGKGPATITGAMSGGNQQKVILAREMDRGPNLLVISQPTRGLDVGAIEYIHKRILAQRDSGCAILLVSYDLDEIMILCDRIAAISSGWITGIFNASDTNKRQIGSLMAKSAKTEKPAETESK